MDAYIIMSNTSTQCHSYRTLNEVNSVEKTGVNIKIIKSIELEILFSNKKFNFSATLVP